MILGGGRPQGGDGVADTGLGEAHHVHVSLHHHQPGDIPQGLAGLVQAVEFPALVEQGGLGGIEVFRLALAEDAAAEGDRAAPGIPEGEDDAVPEPVVVAALFPLDAKTP